MKNNAILFSGGLDSTTLAYQNLKEGNNVLLLYTKILNNPNKTKRELKACEKIKDILRSVFPDKQISLEINEVKIGKHNDNLLFPQIPIHFFSMIESCCENHIDEIQIGYVMGDDAISYINDLQKLYSAHKFLFEKELPKLTFPLSKIKKEIIINKYHDDLIFKELLKHVVFCEDELIEGNVRCGHCHACRRYDYELGRTCIPEEFEHFNSYFRSNLNDRILIDDGEIIYEDPRETE